METTTQIQARHSRMLAAAAYVPFAAKTYVASEATALAVDCLFDACVTIHGPGKAFDEKAYIKYALHAGPEDSSMALRRLRMSNQVLPLFSKDYILFSATTQMCEYKFSIEHPGQKIDWTKVTIQDLMSNYDYCEPIAYDLGLKVEREHVVKTFEQVLDFISGEWL